MKQKKELEIKGIFLAVTLLFLAFLILPLCRLFFKSFEKGGSLTPENYFDVLTGRGFLTSFGNSVWISICGSLLSTLLAFLLAYTIHYSSLPALYKKFIRKAALIPMLLPTITYGFAIIYSFGKQGLITKLAGRQLFDLYGFYGLLLGYLIYTLPVSFLLVSNTMEYIDKKFSIVSQIMGDNRWQTFWGTVVRPLSGTLAASFVQCFFLCFTDYGIPASVGGQYQVVAPLLYNEMLGSILTLLLVLSVFAVIFLVPFVEEWPYQVSFTTEHLISVLKDKSLLGVYKNSLTAAFLTALIGSLTTYGAALSTARSQLPEKVKRVIENISLITNTIPGMVIGIAHMLIFSGTSLQNTLFLIIICNVIHYFSTPYLMMKNSLEKMNSAWETTAMLMGDTWLKTIVRVVTPNAMATILEVFSYYFVNAMVTVSAVIFIAGARTMVITTKIKELQYYTKYNEIFVLSIFILTTNLLAKTLFSYLATDRKKTRQK
ncbi:ABC transporter permease subunit [Lacrimispora sp.]|uniref:ABC transporter permease subunit n=1 Tax=Lacrimispora sp. TaxID=2719234 RepID=UPI00345F6BE6